MASGLLSGYSVVTAAVWPAFIFFGARVPRRSAAVEANRYHSSPYRKFMVSNSPIGASLEAILSSYVATRTSLPFSKSGEVPRAFEQLTSLLTQSEVLRRHPNIRVSWSIGKGNWANVPWVALLDSRETNTTQHGVYAVYLFRRDMSGVYLTFNQGVTEPKKRLGDTKGRRFLAENADELRKGCRSLADAGFSLDNNIDLRVDAGVGADYEGSTIAYKLYSQGRVPSDQELLRDLHAVVKAYDNYLLRREHREPQHWIFQSNPKIWDLPGALQATQEFTFTVRQHKDRIHVGDEVFLWEAGKTAGIVAVATVLTEPVEMAADPVSDRFNRDLAHPFGVETRVQLRVESILPKRVFREQIQEEARLAKLSILRAPTGTNFPVTFDEAQVLHKMIRDAGGLQKYSQSNQPEVTPILDLNAIHASFSEGLKKSHISFGSRHEEVTRAFVASLATKRFVILTGLSGSGKTQIGLRFGEWLGRDRSLVVPVRPDWTGAEAVFGFEDALQATVDGRRAWHTTAVLQFMLRAAQDRNHPYLLLLDEMNLAHVERYFADVLSGMESGVNCIPNLRQEADGSWRLVPNEASLLCFPDNLFIVGTVNIDETTYMFSPKVLDRANTMEFRVESSELTTEARKPNPCLEGPSNLVCGFLEISRDTSWHLTHPATDLAAFANHFRSVHELLNDGGFEFGHRVFYEAVRFASMLESAGDPALENALDLQILQKVLPRLHGSRRRLEPTLCALGQFCLELKKATEKTNQPSQLLFDPLAPTNLHPRLPRSFEKIRRMTRNLRANQFASFTE